MTDKSKIIIGMSGGVDSSVAAYLINKHHHAEGLFMKNWDDSSSDECPAEKDFADAKSVSNLLGITLSSVNFVDEYWRNVFQICLDEFAKGCTPNPDILCNKEIKFKCFLSHALSLGADKIATGHYARVTKNNEHYELRKAIDNQKDQSYFLFRLNQTQLSHCLFPLGELTKPEVRQIAKDQGFSNAEKKDSVGICFIGAKKFKPFLSEYFLAQPGPIVTDSGRTIGKHDGLMFYTLGQRRGLNIGGLPQTDDLPWYVIDKNVKNNILLVGQGHEHPGLYHSTLQCNDIHWISGSHPENPSGITAKIRYRQTDQSCSLSYLNDDEILVTFDSPQWAITPGQSVVFYHDEVCLGGGTITKAQSSTVDKRI